MVPVRYAGASRLLDARRYKQRMELFFRSGSACLVADRGGMAHDLLPVAARLAKSEDGLIEL